MLFITIGLLILAFAGAWGLLKREALKERPLTEPRTDRLTIGVQIICGDCSGDAESPAKTYLDRHGNCARCGGQSFMLASSRIVFAHQLMNSRFSERENGTRLQPIEARTKLYAVRARARTA